MWGLTNRYHRIDRTVRCRILHQICGGEGQVPSGEVVRVAQALPSGAGVARVPPSGAVARAVMVVRAPPFGVAVRAARVPTFGAEVRALERAEPLMGASE